MPRSSLAILGVLLCASVARAEDWPGWRGPRGDGTSTERGLPVKWGKDDNIAWKTPIPGVGHSSPIVHGDKVFVTTCLLDTKQRLLLCLDRIGGKELWRRVVVTAPLERKHKLNSFASSTPATDGERVYATFLDTKHMAVVCYDQGGKELWRKSPGTFHSPHGFCSPPILYKDLVIVNGDQDAVAWIVALDRKTGEERWRTDRPNRTRSYCAPLIVEAGGKTQLVLSGSKCVASYDPDSGKQLWIIDGPTEQYVASLVHTDGVFFMTAGYPDFHNMGIAPDGKVLWHEKKVPKHKASYVPSPIAHGAYFFVVSDEGWAHCFEAKTGKRLWMKQLGRHHSASPVSADGLLYLTDDDGVTYVLRAGPEYAEVARNELDEECYSSPAASRGQLFLRTTGHLWCIGRQKR